MNIKFLVKLEKSGNEIRGMWVQVYRCIASQGEYFEGDHGGIQQ
jgi:hypothetical protein